MKKLYSNFFIILFLIILTFEVLTNSDIVIFSVSTSIEIWIKNLFPTLFPFFVLSDILVNYGFVDILKKYLQKPFNKVFKISGNACFIILMSIISGFPSNAKYIKELLDRKMISLEEANKVILFTHFSNPLFILGTLAYSFLNNYKLGILILIIHYITNVIIGLLFRNYHKIELKNENISLNKILNKKYNFGLIMSQAIINSINTLLLILGTVTVFLILTSLLTTIISNSYICLFIKCFTEMTQGLYQVNNLLIPLKSKAILSIMILSFGGFSVHMQVMSLLSEYKINYIPYLIARLLHASISGILLFILYDFII